METLKTRQCLTAACLLADVENLLQQHLEEEGKPWGIHVWGLMTFMIGMKALETSDSERSGKPAGSLVRIQLAVSHRPSLTYFWCECCKFRLGSWTMSTRCRRSRGNMLDLRNWVKCPVTGVPNSKSPLYLMDDGNIVSSLWS